MYLLILLTILPLYASDTNAPDKDHLTFSRVPSRLVEEFGPMYVSQNQLTEENLDRHTSLTDVKEEVMGLRANVDIMQRVLSREVYNLKNEVSTLRTDFNTLKGMFNHEIVFLKSSLGTLAEGMKALEQSIKHIKESK